eukprot:TRINITY_DN27895_c0_g2_i1.p1 TRINITY_DN27895_c0_g2~~TRINITY_DN27895_c0_g2_i1.p1  ORF type:complete len:209 (-),score=54.54 TRINITY_DN27895_c0_g2_i1:394-1020(-)
MAVAAASGESLAFLSPAALRSLTPVAPSIRSVGEEAAGSALRGQTACAGLSSSAQSSSGSLLGAFVGCGAAAVCWQRHSRRTAASRHDRVRRRVVELPTKEPEIKTTVAIPGAKIEEEEKIKRADEYRLLLFNDPMNKREYVSRCLMTITLLKESDSYHVMMKAHTEGVAVVGTYPFETAEAYCVALRAKGLTVDIIPKDGDDGPTAA